MLVSTAAALAVVAGATSFLGAGGPRENVPKLKGFFGLTGAGAGAGAGAGSTFLGAGLGAAKEKKG